MNGKPYGTIDLLKIYGWKLGLGDLDQAALDGEDKIICSELVARALYAGGVDTRLGVKSFGMVTPAMLAASMIPVVYDWIMEVPDAKVADPHSLPALPDPPSSH
jgi:hypothetical protein